MKFAKELEEQLVPEWRAKYFDYKTGKKKLKAVIRALRAVTGTPKTLKARSSVFTENSVFAGRSPNSSPYQTVPPHSFLNHYTAAQRQLSSVLERRNGSIAYENNGRPSTEYTEGGFASEGERTQSMAFSDRRPSAVQDIDENQTLWGNDGSTNYGSFIPTPPLYGGTMPPPPTLLLPDPALDPGDGSSAQRSSPQASEATMVAESSRTCSMAEAGWPPAHTGGVIKPQGPPSLASTLPPKRRRLFKARRIASSPGEPSPRVLFNRFVSTDSPMTGPRVVLPPPRTRDGQLEAYREFDLRQTQFFVWMDEEMHKIETFYKLKEDEANERLKVLKRQLHEMRDRRLEEIARARQARDKAYNNGEITALLPSKDQSGDKVRQRRPAAADGEERWYKPWEKVWGSTWSNGEASHGKPSQHATYSSSQPGRQNNADTRRDFQRRKRSSDGPNYRQAKRKLKAALSEYYRGLELLKSFTLLNRTAFRKMNKKYDKAVHAYPSGRYMVEKVDKAWFVQSAVLDGHMQTVEDLYARYFERGNHKLAVGKLRSKANRATEYHGSVYRNGLFLGGGAMLGAQGVVYAAQQLVKHDVDQKEKLYTSYLLQIYGGYFLAVLLSLLFCMACRVWSRAKINYVFIFEFDTRHHLDWKQLAELPSFFLFLEGLFVWINFQPFWNGPLFIYYPVILIGLTILVLFFPAGVFYLRSRKWWLYSNWRLLGSGWYPVEFRDFLLGDMYCSQVYTIGNIALFICLYQQKWLHPDRCNSSHSRAFGFMTALPAIWRTLQCLRRYRDTRNSFPHLANGLKYLMTILYYMTLSLYRIDESKGLRALFIVFAVLNSLYCSVWDLAMDWSLLNPYARYPFLREVLGYHHIWTYYAAMVLDPILRFNWIFFVIYTNEIQHSAVLSFLVSFSEVLRRGMWVLFRVENEHCTNVGRFRASRDIPLPYDLPTPSQGSSITAIPGTQAPTPVEPPSRNKSFSAHPALPADLHAVAARGSPRSTAAGYDLERATTYDSSTSAYLRRRRSAQDSLGPRGGGLSRVGTMITQAHAQDFERRRKSVTAGAGGEERDDRDGVVEAPGAEEGTSDDDDEDDEETEEDDEFEEALDEMEERADAERMEAAGEAEAEVDTGNEAAHEELEMVLEDTALDELDERDQDGHEGLGSGSLLAQRSGSA